MKLNHVNLPVQDVAAARTFFETHFSFQPVDIKLNETLSVLKGTGGFMLVLMSDRMNRGGNSAYPDAFHIGFFVDTEEQVRDVFNRLKADGVTLGQEPQLIRKTFGFYFHYQGVLIEIATGG